MFPRRSHRFVPVALLTLFLLPLAGLGAAEEAATVGSIVGRVVDVETGAYVPGATVATVPASSEVRADISGNYRLTDVPAGTYELRISDPDYNLSRITAVELSPGQTLVLDVPLQPIADDVLMMQAYTVSSEVLAESGLGLLITRQKSDSVSDAIASDEMSRLGVGNAAEALGKTLGTTIVDGKYAVIRGLGDRYTNTQMNGAPVPSADPDKRAVQLDQFSSEVIDSVTTYKSFTPDQPGDFAGGSVNIKTKSFPEQFFVSSSINTTYNSNTTGKDILTVAGGGRDWLGRDDGTRGLPEVARDPIPSSLTRTAAQIAARNGDFGPAQELDTISKAFNNAPFLPTPKKADPDFSFGVATGNRLYFGRDQLFGYTASLTYSRSTDHYAGGISGRYQQGSSNPDNAHFVDALRVFTTNVDEYNFASLYQANPDVPGGTPAFGVTKSTQNVDWGAYLQMAWRPSADHEVSATVFHNQSASDSVTRGVGEATRSDSGGEFRQNNDLLYTERGIGSVQLAGKSNFPALNDSTLEWRAAVSRSTQEQPDYRNYEFKWSFILQDWDPSGVTTRRYFRDLKEDSVDFGLDFTSNFSLPGGRELTTKIGGAYFDSDRTNSERGFLVEGGNIRTLEGIQIFPNPVGITGQTANSVTFGSTMREISANLNYTGGQTFSAGYLMGDLRWNDRWRAIGGARLERTEILTTPMSGKNGEIRQTDLLPALSVVWSPWQQQNIRFSYGKTLARPTFRELASVVVYEPFTDDFVSGNADLEMTKIDNYDLRWEWFPRGGEVIATSLFYKKLKNPIEEVFSSGRIAPNNAEDGVAYGVEFEARRKLDLLSSSLGNLTVGFNGSLIKSEVTIDPAELALIRAVFPDASDKRELFGQSPYILNLDATYELPSWGSNLTVVYGVFGERLKLVTNGALPDVYEQPAPALDLIWSQYLSANWRLKVSGKNLLDPAHESTLEHNGKTYLYERYTQGRSFSLSFSYSFE